MVTAAVVPVLTLPIDREFAGPAGPGWRTNESFCDGAVPLMLTVAVAPVLTLPIDNEFAGPVGPRGSTNESD
jgi:hypothetical protein